MVNENVLFPLTTIFIVVIVTDRNTIVRGPNRCHHMRSSYMFLLKSDNTNSKHQHQHRVTELDGQGSEGELTAAYRDKN